MCCKEINGFFATAILSKTSPKEIIEIFDGGLSAALVGIRRGYHPITTIAAF